MTRRTFFRMFGLAAIVAPVARLFAKTPVKGVLTQEYLDQCAAVLEAPVEWTETACFEMGGSTWIVTSSSHETTWIEKADRVYDSKTLV